MDPSVFLTNPDSGAVKAFMRIARPGIRRWVQNHYEHFRMQWPRPANGFPGSHSIQAGYMFRHHLAGEYSTSRDGQPRLRSYDFRAQRNYPQMNGDFPTWLHQPPAPATIFADGTPVPAFALQADLQQGGQSTYYLLPSLAKMLTDNIRLGLATPNQIIQYIAVTIMTFDNRQKDYAKSSPRARANIFDTAGDEYTLFDTLDALLRAHPDYDGLCTAARVDPGRGLNARAARRIISVEFEGSLEDFKDIEYNKFKEAVQAYYRPLVSVLTAPFPIGQVVGVLEINDKAARDNARNRDVGWNNLRDNIKDGNWRVTQSSSKNNKPVVNLISEADANFTMKDVSASVLFIPPGETDIRHTSDLRNNAALPLFEAAMEAFLYFEHLNTMALSKINHTRFTKEHFREYDGTQIPGGWNTGKDGKFFGDWFIDARTDHTTAFFANMWDKKPKMRKSLENLFKDDNFALSEIQWYTDIIANHLNPALIPQMQKAGLPTKAVIIAPVVPEDRQFQMVGDLTKIDLKLESPLLRDAYLAYTNAFNAWFSSLLIGANRGFLFRDPFGPEGPGGDAKKAKKQIKSARESMAGSVKEAWNMARTSVLSLRNIGIKDEQILRVLKEEVTRAHEGLETSRPALPPGGSTNLNMYLDFISDLYENDPNLLAAISSAADRLRIDSVENIDQIEDMFITDIKRHLKMKALGTVRFPALATAIEILRGYVVIPAAQLQEFVASQLNDDIRARIATRAGASQGFVTPGEPTIVPPRAPPVLRMEGPP